MKISSLMPENPRKWLSSNQSELGIILLRTMIALMWLSQAITKVVTRDPTNEYQDFNHFKNDLFYMGELHPWETVGDFVLSYLVPNWQVMLFLVLIVEFGVGILLLSGLFTRLASFTGAAMTASLFILTLGWGEWIWTYPLIFMPHVVLFLSRSGKVIGIDRYVEQAQESGIFKILG